MQTAHDSSLKSEQIDETVTYLSKTIDSVQLEEDYSTALAGDQLDKIECAAINLSSAIMECLAVAITARKRSIFRRRESRSCMCRHMDSPRRQTRYPRS